VLAFAMGPVLSAALGIISLPILAWFFKPEDIGRNNIFQTAVSLAMLILVLGLDQAYVREYHESKNRDALFKSCYLPAIFALLCIIGATSPFAEELAEILYGERKGHWYLLTLLGIAFALTSRFLSLILRMQERGLAYSMSQLLPKLMLVLTLVFYVLAEIDFNYDKLLLANLVAMGSVVAVFGWNSRTEWAAALKATIDPNELKQLLKFGIPLIAAGAAYWALRATSTVALRIFSDFAELGIYAMSMSFAGLANIFQIVFSTVWMPTVYKWFANDGDSFLRVQTVTRLVLAGVCCILAFVGSFTWLVTFVLPDAYAKVQYILVACMIQPLLYTVSETTVVSLNIARKTSYMVWIALSALFVNALLSVALTPLFGAAGAAAANALAFFAFFVGRTEVSSHISKRSRPRRIYVALAAYVSAAVLTALFGGVVGAMLSLVWCVILLSTLVVFRRELSEILKFLRNGTMSRPPSSNRT